MSFPALTASTTTCLCQWSGTADEAIDFLVVEKIFVTARGGNFLADNFLRERVAAIVEVASGDAFDAGELDGVAKQAGTLHADADNAKPQTVARRSRLQGQRNVLRLKKNGGRGSERARGARSAMEKLTAGKIFGHGALLEEVNSRLLKVESKIRKLIRNFWPVTHLLLLHSLWAVVGKAGSQSLRSIYFRGWTLTSLKKTMSLSL